MRPVLRSSLHTSIPKSAASAGRNGETDTAQTEESLDIPPSAASRLNAKRIAAPDRNSPYAMAVV